MQTIFNDIWERYYSLPCPIPITSTNPNISDAGDAFIYRSLFFDLQNYLIYFDSGDYDVLSEENKFSIGKGTIYIQGNSKIVNHRFCSFNNTNQGFIYCFKANSTATEGSISSFNNIYLEGTLTEYLGQANIESMNFSRCKAFQGAAILCYGYILSNTKLNNSIFGCYIDSCNATQYGIVNIGLITYTKLIKSNIINNTQETTQGGIIYAKRYSARIDIQYCILKDSCQNNNAPYFSTDENAQIYIYHTISDSNSTSGYTIDMSDMKTNPFENNFLVNNPFICDKTSLKKSRPKVHISLYAFLRCILFCQALITKK